MRSRRVQRVRFICIKGCVRKVQMDFPLNPLSPIRGGKYDKAEEFLRDLEEVEPRKENYYHRLPLTTAPNAKVC
jgi:hypothetical protein